MRKWKSQIVNRQQGRQRLQLCDAAACLAAWVPVSWIMGNMTVLSKGKNNNSERESLPSSRVPVPLAFPAPLIATLWALKMRVPFLKRCHTLAIGLRTLH